MTSPFKVSTEWNPYEMHAALLPTPADKMEWHLQRRGGIGASECAPILGLSHYEGDTAYSVWLSKTGRVPIDLSTSEAAEWGHILEPVIRDTAAERLGYDVATVGGLQSRRHEWMRASLDAVLMVPDDGPIPLEVKSTSVYLAADWADDQVPDRAELQVQHQLAVTGAPYGFVAGLIGGQRLVIRRVDRDQELIDHIIAEESAFWRHVVEDTAPPVTARESLAELVASAGVPDVDELVVDPAVADEVRRWAAAYQQAGRDEKAAQEKKREARNNLVVLAEGHSAIVERSADIEHTILKLQRGVFAAKRFTEENPDLAPLFEKKVTVIDTKALRAEDPDLYRRYQSVSVRIPKGGAA